MSRVLLYGFFAGLAVALLSVTFWPLTDNLRVRSLIDVRPDGGREESFLIRWPEDRLALPDGPAHGAEAVLFDTSDGRVSAELFRVRNADGNVIGVAGRVAAAGEPGTGGFASDWLIVIPSRGALFMTQADARDTTARRAQAGGGEIVSAADGSFRAGDNRIAITTSPGRIIRGTNEFSGLAGTYTETWELDGMNADGSTQGRIVLSTISMGTEGQ